MRIGIADHLGWAVAVAATADHRVVDRRRIELVEPDAAWAPIHHEGKGLDLDEVVALVAATRAAAARATAASLDELAADLPAPVESLSMRLLPTSFPTDMPTLRQSPWEARADAVMYREILAAAARDRGWRVDEYDAKTVEAAAADVLGHRAHTVLHGPRDELGPPWTKDHRVALAATVIVEGGNA